MRIAVILLAILWGLAAVGGLLRTRNKTFDAKLTAAYILAYPLLVLAVFLSEPVPMWLAVPVVFGFIPWLMAGPHLWQSVRDPASRRPDEVMGIPKAYWLWGGLSAFLLGLVFG